MLSGLTTFGTILAALALEWSLGGIWSRGYLPLAIGATAFATWRMSSVSLLLWGGGVGLVMDSVSPVSFGTFLVAIPSILAGGILVRYIFSYPSSLLVRGVGSIALAVSSLAVIPLYDRSFSLL